MPDIKLTIDGTELQVEPGTTILEAARQIGADIPTLCHHPALKPNGACRLCLVEVEKAKALVASCVTPVAPGMVVHTESERVVKARKDILRLLVANHPLVCIVCEKTGACKLQDYCYRYDIDDSHYSGEVKELPLDESNEFFVRDMNKCILCGICVSMCQDVVGVGAIDFTKRGFATNVGAAYEDKIEDSTCVFCGLCIDHCPVGALTVKSAFGKGRPFELETTKAVCPYCSVGCTLELHTNKEEVTQVTPHCTSPVNRGQLCSKGKFGWDYFQSEARLTAPLIKSEGVFVEVTWEEALSFTVDHLDRIKRLYGDQALMGLVSSLQTNEESYLLQKLIRSLGSNNIDSYTRHCHAPAMRALRHALGSAALTNSIEELCCARAILVVGSEPAKTHPVISYRVHEAVHRGADLITAGAGKESFKSLPRLNFDLKPAAAAVLVNTMAQVILDEELHDQKYVARRGEDFEGFKKAVALYTPERAHEITGLPAEKIKEAARLFARAESAAIVAGAGTGAEGEELVTSLINLALLTGNIGKKAGGLYLLFGESNLQGCLDMGTHPAFLPGYQLLEDKKVRERFAEAWQVPLNPEPGLSAAEVFDTPAAQSIKAMLILGENPVSCSVGSNHADTVLKNLDFLLVQELFMTETAALADVILPSAAFAEKTGTYTNLERRVQLNRPALDPPGKVFSDWRVIAELAGWLGFEWEYASPADIFAEMAALNPQYAGINYNRLAEGGLQWPCPKEGHPGTQYLYEGRFRRGLGLFTAPLPPEHFSRQVLSDEETSLTHDHCCICSACAMKNHSSVAGL